MEILHHPDLKKDFKNLKRFAAPEESLMAWERLFLVKGLNETFGIERYPGFQDNIIYKARVVPLKESCGKSGGYRLIFQLKGQEIILILVFSRHGIYKDEKELQQIIKSRISN